MAKKITPETDTKAAEAERQLQELNEIIAKVKAAQTKFATYTQQQVDDIFRAAAIAANEARIPLAKMAVAETGMGVIEDKVIKNHFASEYVYNKYKTEKTCDTIEYDEGFGIIKLAEPVSSPQRTRPPRQSSNPFSRSRHATALFSVPIRGRKNPRSKRQESSLKRLSPQELRRTSSAGLRNRPSPSASTS